MKRKILVLDVYTNGHEAALAFIAKQGWSIEECEIVFCGTHQKLLQKLSEGPAYAVVPVHNSIAGEVGEVTKALARFRDMGYEMTERDRLGLQINHCLLAPKHITRVEDLDLVISHEKAMTQCGIYLDRVGIPHNKRGKKSSTGNAAKYISKAGPKSRIGAIAPKAAAVAYGLNVLAENIQDVQVNITTFLLLQNEAIVEKLPIGIIGIGGRVGQMFRSFFEGLGCTVIGSDQGKPTGLSNADVVRQSSVVIFSVPISETPSVIREMIPFSSEKQLWMDVTSIKQPAVTAMLESNAQVVGLHPMFRPEASFNGQTVVACPVRLSDPRWKTWVVNMLAVTRARIKWSDPAQHDKYMTTVQGMPHLANLVSALHIMQSGVSVSESLAFTSPFYRILFSLMGRLVSQNSVLYSSIVMENPETVAMLESRMRIEGELLDIIRKKDHAAFQRLFTEARGHFGEQVTKEANELFVRILAVLSTLYGSNSVTLEFASRESRPGLLGRVLEVFTRREINLTGINAVNLEGDRLQFAVSFEQSPDSHDVRLALEEIEGWVELDAKIIEH